VGWAHTFWFLFKPQPGEEPDAAAKDLARDPAISLIDELFWVPQTALVLVLFGLGYAYGGIAVACSWVVWGVGVRTTAVYHVTWLVNSAAHTMGYQTYDTGDNSRNTWWVALFSFGEGWHNNHHHKQRSAAHGMKWFELDPTFWMIGLLGFLGLAKDVIMPDGRLIFKSKQNLVQEEIRK
jgi:stearoyl-CoA desaturase (delta-9 desaturase)